MKTQTLTLTFGSFKAAHRAWCALALLSEVGVLPRTLGFRTGSEAPKQITLYTGEEPLQ